MPKEPQVNWDFIRTLEGFELKGYVPKDRDVNDRVPSGVTIVGGFDIGQHSKLEVKDLNISSALKEKIKIYAEVTGNAARAMLKQHPLLLSKEEGIELDNAVKELHLESIMREYNDNSKIDFLALAEPMQTVVASVAFQYGSLKKKTPNFFKSIVSNDWNKAYEQLLNFGDAYKSRRHKEAAYLKRGL